MKLLLIFIMALVSCGYSPQLGMTQIVQIDGSSTVYPVTEAIAEEFQRAKKGKIRITVGISGTGGGFKKFCRGEIDISGASRPIKQSEIDACRRLGIDFVELPVAFDALTVVIHPKNDWAATMSVVDLKKIWEPAAQGNVMRWNQIRPKWPGTPLRLFGPGADSGTFEYFTEAIVGQARASRGDFTASEDDHMLVQGVATDKNALGYFGYAYFAENQNILKAASIDGGKGPVAPSAKTVENGTYQPLSRPIFIYVSNQSGKKTEVKEFVDFYLQNAGQLVKQVKYIPLPAKAYRLALAHFHKGKFGTVFGGKSEVGVTIEELLMRETK